LWWPEVRTVPPHCDTLDGPAAKAARLALERGNVHLILPYVPRAADAELRRAFERATRVRALSPEAKETVDYWFFETAVRLHREGEGVPYTGLKLAGLDPGPAVPRAEKAMETGRFDEITRFLHDVLDCTIGSTRSWTAAATMRTTSRRRAQSTPGTTTTRYLAGGITVAYERGRERRCRTS
jgi:hypothetical protein